MSHRQPVVVHRDKIKQSQRLSQRQIEASVHRSVPPGVVGDMVKYLDAHEPSLQGEQRPETLHEWRRDMTYLFLHHEITGTGYNDEAFDLAYPYHVNHNSLGHNVGSIRHKLGEWGRSKVVRGNLASWKNAVTHCRLDPLVEDTLLWIDSVDIQVEGKRSVSRKSGRWSFKLNAPGRRYMTVRDGRGSIVNVWGGYTPKLHDGEFLELHKDEILSYFDGSCFIGDNHFSKGKRIFKNRIKFHTNYAERSSKKNAPGVDLDEDYVEKITQANKKFNKQHQEARARVESPYGWAKNKFATLRTAWRESDDHLDDMMLFTFGLHNVTINGL